MCLNFLFTVPLPFFSALQTILFFIQAKIQWQSRLEKVQVRKNKLPLFHFFKKCLVVVVGYWKKKKVEHKYIVPSLYSIHSKLVRSCWYIHCAQTNYSVLYCCVGLCKLTLTRYLIPHTTLFILLKKAQTCYIRLLAGVSRKF